MTDTFSCSESADRQIRTQLVFDLDSCSIGICPVSNCLDGISSAEEERESAAQRGRGPGLRACAAVLVETDLV